MTGDAQLRRRNQSTSVLIGANLDPTLRKRAPVILVMLQVSVELCIIRGIGQPHGVEAGQYRCHSLLKLGLCFVEGRQRRDGQELIREVVNHHRPEIDEIRQQRMKIVHGAEDCITGIPIVGCQDGKFDSADNCIRVSLDSHGDNNAIVSATGAAVRGPSAFCNSLHRYFTAWPAGSSSMICSPQSPVQISILGFGGSDQLATGSDHFER